jgi:hypothetical protein
MSNEKLEDGLASHLTQELEPSAEELLRLLLEQFFVDWKGELEWSNREGITLANQIGKDKERLFAKYLTSPNKQDYAVCTDFGVNGE